MTLFPNNYPHPFHSSVYFSAVWVWRGAIWPCSPIWAGVPRKLNWDREAWPGCLWPCDLHTGHWGAVRWLEWWRSACRETRHTIQGETEEQMNGALGIQGVSVPFCLGWPERSSLASNTFFCQILKWHSVMSHLKGLDFDSYTTTNRLIPVIFRIHLF